MDSDRRTAQLERLEPFLGDWRIDAPAFPLAPELAARARSSFTWALDGAFLLQRSSIPVPEAPDGLSLVAPADDDGYLQHYFDSRGVARLYAMRFDGRDWTLERHAPDFSPLPFHQRWTGRFSADERTIEGRWETSSDGHTWELDFELAYRRLDAPESDVDR